MSCEQAPEAERRETPGYDRVYIFQVKRAHSGIANARSHAILILGSLF